MGNGRMKVWFRVIVGISSAICRVRCLGVLLFVGPTSLDGFLHGRGGSDRSGFQQSTVVAAAATIATTLWLAAAGA